MRGFAHEEEMEEKERETEGERTKTDNGRLKSTVLRLFIEKGFKLSQTLFIKQQQR